MLKERENSVSFKTVKRICAATLLLCLMLVMTACSGDGDDPYVSPFDGRDLADLSGYESMGDYDGDTMLVLTTMDEVDELMENDESFAVMFSYENCPYCNLLMPYVNEAAAEAGVRVGYIDTRSNPEWMSNMDIDDYDKVVDRFGRYLSEDDDGKEHLYTPDMYFIKNGRVKARHDGVTEGADDPEQELTSSQEEQLLKDLAEAFNAVK